MFFLNKDLTPVRPGPGAGTSQEDPGAQQTVITTAMVCAEDRKQKELRGGTGGAGVGTPAMSFQSPLPGCPQDTLSSPQNKMGPRV